MKTIDCKKTVITSLDDLVEVFPSMTLHQVIIMYRSGLDRLKYYDSLLDGTHELTSLDADVILDKIGFYLDCTEFLAGYLARCFCCQNGYIMD